MLTPTPHPWCVRDDDGIRYFSNAPCAAATALDAGVRVYHPKHGWLDRGECLRVVGMSVGGQPYEEWLKEMAVRESISA